VDECGKHLEDFLVQVAELEHGDRFQLGEHVFQLVLERRRREPRAYVLPDQ